MNSTLLSSDVKNKGDRRFTKSSDRAVGTQTAVSSLEKRNTFTRAPAYGERSFNTETPRTTLADRSQSHNPNAAQKQARGDLDAKGRCLLPTRSTSFPSLLRVKCYSRGSKRGKGQQWHAKLLLHSRTETEELARKTWAPKYQTKYQIDGGVQRWGHPLAYVPRWLEGNGQEMLLEKLRAILSGDMVGFSCIHESGEQNPALQVIFSPF